MAFNENNLNLNKIVDGTKRDTGNNNDEHRAKLALKDS